MSNVSFVAGTALALGVAAAGGSAIGSVVGHSPFTPAPNENPDHQREIIMNGGRMGGFLGAAAGFSFLAAATLFGGSFTLAIARAGATTLMGIAAGTAYAGAASHSE